MVVGKFVPPTIQMSVKFHDFEELCSHQFSTNHLSNRHPTTIAPKYQESRDNRAKSFNKVIFSRLFQLIRVCTSHLAQCQPRLSDSEEDTRVKGLQKVSGAGKRPPLLSPVSSHFIFMFALSQFSGPDYLRAWKLLAQCSNLTILLILRCSFQRC